MSESWRARKRAYAKMLARELYEKGMIRTWLRDKPEGWVLLSGLWSPCYIQLRNVPSYPKLLGLIGRALGEMIQAEAPEVNRLVGVAAAGVPLATAASLAIGMPFLYTRKLPGVRKAEEVTAYNNEYGEHAMVEGEMAEGDRLAIIDDVIARFTGKKIALRQIELELRHRKLNDVKTTAIAVVIDREQGAISEEEREGARLLSLVRFRAEGLGLLKGVANARELAVIADYLENPEAFQDKRTQENLREEALKYQKERRVSKD